MPHRPTPEQDASIALTDLAPDEIAARLELKPYQGRQVFRWIHRKRVFDLGAMTDLPKALRQRWAGACLGAQLRVHDVSVSHGTGTRKALFHLGDGETIESVLLRDRQRYTICLSTQVGCRVGCPFCATGSSGFVRNLRPGEIVEQALYFTGMKGVAERTPNLVYMGMGEPFHNYEAVVKSIRLLMRKDGLGIGARRITVSTVGDVPGIRRFAGEGWQVRLSISLHAANDAVRSRLVPLNRKYPLESVLAAVREYTKETGRQVTYEWVLLRGVNDRIRDANDLAGLIRGTKSTVNLIPYNPVPGCGYESPPRPRAVEFRDALIRKDISVTLRRTQGGDIDAACGQLRRRSRGGAHTP